MAPQPQFIFERTELEEHVARLGAIQTAIGRQPTCFRPPYGSTNSWAATEPISHQGNSARGLRDESRAIACAHRTQVACADLAKHSDQQQDDQNDNDRTYSAVHAPPFAGFVWRRAGVFAWSCRATYEACGS